jgi:hypothetical protein
MGNPKIAVVAYCLAVGFILAVAFHSPSNTLITALWASFGYTPTLSVAISPSPLYLP